MLPLTFRTVDSTPTLTRFLVRTPFFGGLPDEGLERIVGMLDEKSFNKGDAVFREGDPGRSMFIIGDGELVACRAGPSGMAVKLTRYHRGDFFGETTLIAMLPRSNTVFAETPATLYELTSGHLYRLYQQDVATYIFVLQNINRELCRRLHKGEGRIASVADAWGDDATQIRSALKLYGDDE